MKKLIIALSVSALLLSGCGMFRSQHAWKKAQQENPLQVPPGMDRPATTDALTIPPPTNSTQQTTAQPAARGSANTNRMQLAGDVDTVYKRVGLALQHGDLGTVTGQDAAAHTYTLSISTQSAVGSSQSFMQKHFSNVQQRPDGQADADAAADRAAAGVRVELEVSPAADGQSLIMATGDPQQAIHIISALRGRLGG